jgi:hypothetical protein
MPVPVFEFTDRATPIVQMGRSENRVLGNARWSTTGRWGTTRWGVEDWEPAWTDVTCEVHEVTVDVGRGSATDRFRPGTASIIASNVHQLSDAIFPTIETGRFEPVPQPPIEKAENLQAPNAATVTSNGWDFTDDFATAPPHWVFPQAWADTGGVAWCRMFRTVDGGWEPDLYEDHVTHGYVGAAAAQWTQRYDPAGNMEIAVLIDADWPATPTAGTPQLLVDLYLGMNGGNQECYAARFRLVPTFGGANEVFLEIWHMGPDGAQVDGQDFGSFTGDTGTNGQFGPQLLSFRVDRDPFTSAPVLFASMGDVFTDMGWAADVELGGSRIGLWTHYTQGAIGPTVVGGPRVTLVAGADFVDDLTRPLGSGWQVPPRWAKQGHRPMVQVDGAMTPDNRFSDEYGGTYTGAGTAQWVSTFVGDQYVDVEVAGMSVPGQTRAPFAGAANLRLYTHANPSNLAAMVAEIQYWVDWDGTGNEITWRLIQRGAGNELVNYDPTATGVIPLGATGGVHQEPARWRVESDLLGEQRLYYNGALLYTTIAPSPPGGGRVGVYADSARSAPGTAAVDPPTVRAGNVRVLRASAGLREPLGTEDVGMWVRIGVDHDTLGACWFFRGFVDGLVPVYVPDRPDTVRIECIDALGEAGRASIKSEQVGHQIAEAHLRIRQVLQAGHWPRKKTRVGDDATPMSRPSSGKVVDALTHIAESCGGAVYGDPVTGDVVFRGQDWQGHAANGPTLAYITNHDPGDDDVIRVCPVGWERTSRRADMTTRVRFTTAMGSPDDNGPIVREWRSPEAEAVYGVEMYERSLLCTTGQRVNELANRQLRLRSPVHFPRVQAVLLDAATAVEALDLMASATFTRPSKYQCSHREAGAWVFNRSYLVTGIRHVMSPTRWTTRLALDITSAFTETGGRWGKAHWGVDKWGRTR